MIDIDKFITSLLKSKRKPLTYINDEKVVLVSYDAIVQALEEQGLEFRDGSISRVEPSIPEIVEEHFDEMLEDKSNPDNLHQYLYGSNEEEKIRKDIIWCLKHSGVKESNPINPHVTTIAKDAIAWLEKQGEQKPAETHVDWCVEDEKMLKVAMESCKKCGNGYAYHWLKSLKDRVRLQNGYNPYKEVVESIAEMCEKYKLPTSDLSDFFDNVKVKCKEAKEFDTMFPQNTWKPSEEQMEALKLATYCQDSKMSKILFELYEQLKAL